MSISLNTRDYTKLVQALNPDANINTEASSSSDAFSMLLNMLQDTESTQQQALQKQQQSINTGNPALEAAFQKAADTYNIPVNLLKAVGKAESGFRADAVSKCGAIGIMQLMPATARGLGVNDPYDAEQNIMGGAKFLRSLLDRYDGDVKLSLAAYNAGPGNVEKYGGVPPFKETQNYIPKVLAYAGEDLTIPASSSSQALSALQEQSESLAQANLMALSGNNSGNDFFHLDFGNISAIIRNNPDMAPALADLLKYRALSLLGEDENA